MHSTDLSELIAEHQKNPNRALKAVTGQLLTTEKYHPKTISLAEAAQTDLPQALTMLKEVDDAMLKSLSQFTPELNELKFTVQATLAAGNRIYLSGCGAAGRAGVFAAKVFTDTFPNLQDKVIAIMAGGEGALVRAAEGFEDNAEFGKRQLLEAGWQPQDLLICLSASGSANFLYGQLQYAASQARDANGQKPYFHICNTEAEVREKFSDKNIFKEPSLREQIRFLSTNIGEMALAGSTRMQAATVQILSMGLALLNADLDACITALQAQLTSSSFDCLIPLIEAETSAYQHREGVYYFVSAESGLTVLTDTTERSPSFSLPYFENDLDPQKGKNPSLCRVIIDGSEDSMDAWHKILNRDPRPLNWDERVNLARLLGNEISLALLDKRKTYMPDTPHHQLKVKLDKHSIHFQFDSKELEPINLTQLKELPDHVQPLAEQVFLKLALNNASTLIAGRLGLYASNLMTHVRASNLKLIDRGIRLTYELLEQASKMEDALPALKSMIASQHSDLIKLIAEQLYKQMQIENADKPIVVRTKESVISALAEAPRPIAHFRIR